MALNILPNGYVKNLDGRAMPMLEFVNDFAKRYIRTGIAKRIGGEAKDIYLMLTKSHIVDRYGKVNINKKPKLWAEIMSEYHATKGVIQ